MFNSVSSTSLRRRFSALLLALLVLLLSACAEPPISTVRLELTNLAHLNYLTQEVEIDGRQMAITRIYSEYPDYGYVPAANEGIAAVDDAARAAVVYLRHHELTDDSTSLRRARGLLEFVRFMQTDDGQFYNFIWEDFTVNDTGRTSFKSFGWWAARGVWALGVGYRSFAEKDTNFARVLEQHLQRSFVQMDTLLLRYGQTKVVDGYRYPRWLISETGADATSEMLLGLTAYYQAKPTARVAEYLRKFGEGIGMMQYGTIGTFPYRALLAYQGIWHGWGSSQMQALSEIGSLLREESFLRVSEEEAIGWRSRLLIDGNVREFTLEGGLQNAVRFDQIAYAQRCQVVGLLRLAEATRKEVYAKMAGLAAGWFLGGNDAGVPMYDPETGRGYDGILDSTRINQNAGAESTIEALLAIMEAEANPVARRYMRYRPVTAALVEGSRRYRVFANDAGETVRLVLDQEQGRVWVEEVKGRP